MTCWGVRENGVRWVLAGAWAGTRQKDGSWLKGASSVLLQHSVGRKGVSLETCLGLRAEGLGGGQGIGILF